MGDGRAVFAALESDDPDVVAGYRLAARIGAGGMGRVYLSHTLGGRPVAIKVVRPELADAPDFRRRFRREVDAARRVRGAYTAELIDADADGVPPWLATLYVPGPSLAEAVARSGPLPVSLVLRLIAGVAEALQAIHGAGIVHRDLKPSNVLLAADGPRVIDFGISLASDATSYTVTGSTVGTPSFMAPEQAAGGEITAATDVFALGQTAAFAAIGRPLYGDGPAVSVLYRIVHSAPDLEQLPAPLRPLLSRCLAAEPGKRAGLAEIVEWCRRQSDEEERPPGSPAGFGIVGAADVWREVRGPEVAVPGPAGSAGAGVTAAVPPAGVTAVQTAAPGTASPMPLIAPPYGPYGPGAYPGPEVRRAKRRRHALVTAVGVTAAVALFGALAWTFLDGKDRVRGGSASGASASTSASPRASGAVTAGGGGAAAADDARNAGEGAGEGEGEAGSGRKAGGDGRAADAPSASSGPPRPLPYPMQWLDEKNSLSVKEPVERGNRKGDVRLVCGEVTCSFESRTSRMAMYYGEPGATLDSCRSALEDPDGHSLSLAGASAGSEICIEHPSGDIALFVIQVKSTAMANSGSSFVTGDMTVWRAAGSGRSGN
ncbi:Serine/threonine-protein kinase AfsK [Streptomyces sp. YIM 130001]|uniref:serine/threonine-protein kinase n=1 Tax=Streptomyces sp. YIM 130001 TaxID=2259644 RepID=UPI000EC4BAE1|nr:serine/threonine-protein kinase [Streptomyces sp. YIM 130001]RII11219.1 Serine/threonine-protein kinase AfsK [Streptomyces sp. YIM 130001]